MPLAFREGVHPSLPKEVNKSRELLVPPKILSGFDSNTDNLRSYRACR